MVSPCCFSAAARQWKCPRARARVHLQQLSPRLRKTSLPSASRFIATLHCERVHELCLVPALRPDNYRYIYQSKWEPWARRDYRVEQKHRGKKGGVRDGRVGEARGKMRRNSEEERRATWGDQQVSKIALLIFAKWQRARRAVFFIFLVLSLRCFLF